MKFVPAKTFPKPKQPPPPAQPGAGEPPQEEFRFLTPEEVKTNVMGLSMKIVDFVKNEIVQRFTTPPDELAITSADGMQVAIASMAAAEGILAVEALKAGLPVEKVREIHDNIFTATLRSQMAQ